MNNRRLIVALCLACLAPLARAGAAAGDQFTTVTTHVEGYLWRMLKIERREPLPLPATAGPMDLKQPARQDQSYLGLFSLSVHKDAQQRPILIQAQSLEIPFFNYLSVNQQGTLLKHFNLYWFALYDGIVQKDYEKTNAYGGNSTYASFAFFNAPLIFTLFDEEFSAPDKVNWDALTLPLLTTLSHRYDEKEDHWQAMNIPFFWGYRYDKKENTVSTDLCNAADVAIIYTRSQEGGHDTRDFIHIPFTSLWRAEQTSPQSSNRQYVMLPILGPVVATWTGEEGNHWGIFPKLFCRKTCPESIKTFFE
jgi:hypothetical protein